MALSTELQAEFAQRSQWMNTQERQALRKELESRNIQTQTNNIVPTPDTPISTEPGNISATPITTPVTPVVTVIPSVPEVTTPITVTPITTTPTVVEQLTPATNAINQVWQEANNRATDTTVQQNLSQQQEEILKQQQLAIQMIEPDQRLALEKQKIALESAKTQSDIIKSTAWFAIEQDKNLLIDKQSQRAENVVYNQERDARFAEYQVNIEKQTQNRLNFIARVWGTGLSQTGLAVLSTKYSQAMAGLETTRANLWNAGQNVINQIDNQQMALTSSIESAGYKYGKETATLYEQAETAKSYIAYMKETNPIQYNLKVSEINEKALKAVNDIELEMTTDVDTRLELAEAQAQAVATNVTRNQTILSAQIDKDIVTGAIYKYPEAELTKIATLIGTTPSALKARSSYMVDTAIAQAITSSGKTYSATQVATMTAQARSLVQSGFTTAQAIAQVTQEYGIVPRNEVNLWNNVIYDRNTGVVTNLNTTVANANTVDFIKSKEWFRSQAYLDSAWVPTIWYGFISIDGKPVKLWDTITQEEADKEFTKQIQRYQNWKNFIDENTLSEAQKTALTSFEYNLGSGIWAKSADSILNKIKSWDITGAQADMKQYVNAGGKFVQWLANRRAEEANLLWQLKSSSTTTQDLTDLSQEQIANLQSQWYSVSVKPKPTATNPNWNVVTISWKSWWTTASLFTDNPSLVWNAVTPVSSWVNLSQATTTSTWVSTVPLWNAPVIPWAPVVDTTTLTKFTTSWLENNDWTLKRFNFNAPVMQTVVWVSDAVKKERENLYKDKLQEYNVAVWYNSIVDEINNKIKEVSAKYPNRESGITDNAEQNAWQKEINDFIESKISSAKEWLSTPTEKRKLEWLLINIYK